VAVPVVGSIAAPQPKDGKPAYCLTRVGDRCVYSITARGKTDETRHLVTAVEQADGAVLVSVGLEHEHGDPAPYLKLKLTDAGVYMVRESRDEFDPPVCLLKLPVKAGDSWSVERPAVGELAGSKRSYRTAGDEDVEVPAGKFRAVRVEETTEWTGHLKGLTTQTTTWYAPSVGRVKEVHKVGQSEMVTVLKSFVPAKK
jgi:hypothetical protein